MASSGNSRYQCRACFGTDRSSKLRPHSLGQKNLTASGQFSSLPGDMKDVMGGGLFAIGCRARFASQLDHQLLCSNLNARYLRSNQSAVINRQGRFKMLPNRFYD
jgi:hypothetical protein